MREDLEALAAEVAPPPDRLRDAPGGGDVGAESHGDYPTGRVTPPTRGDRTGARALRPEPDRQAPCGRRAHGPVQLAHRPAHRRDLRAAAGGHRPRAVHAGERGRDPPRDDVARARLGRGPVPPERAGRRVRRRDRAPPGRRRDLPRLRDRGGGRGAARRRPRRQARARGAREARPQPRGDRGARGGRAPPGVALRRRRRRPDGHRGLRPRPRHLRARRHRGLHRGPLRRHAHLQPRGRRRRHGDGHHARHPRRGPHLQHAQADDGHPGARLRDRPTTRTSP